MNVYEQLVAVIRQNTNRPIYADQAPETAVAPFYVYSINDSSTDYCLDGAPAFHNIRIGIDAVAESSGQANEMVENAAVILQGLQMGYERTNGDKYRTESGLFVWEAEFALTITADAVLSNSTITGSAQVGSVPLYISSTGLGPSDTLVVQGGDLHVKQNLIVSGNFIGAMESASYALTAAYAMNGGGGVTASWSSLIGKPAGLVSSSAQIDFNVIQNQPATVPTASFVAWSNVSGKPAGIVSGSQIPSASYAETASYVTWTNVNGKPTVVSSSAQVLNGTGIFSASAQLPANLVSSSLQVLQGSGVYSASAQISLVTSASFAVTASWAPTKAGVVSSSAQVLQGSGVYSASAQLPANLVSSSLQVLQGSGVYSSSAQVSSASYALTASYALSGASGGSTWDTITGKPSGIVSSSAQVDYNSIQNKPATIATASFVATASWSNRSVSASFAPTNAGVVSASNGTASVEFLHVSNDAYFERLTVNYNIVGSISNAQTADMASTAGTATNANFASVADLASWAEDAIHATTASFADTSSWALNAKTASFVTWTDVGGKPSGLVSSSVQVTNVTSASYAVTASYVIVVVVVPPIGAP